MRITSLLAGLILLAGSPATVADTIFYSADNLAGSSWQYNYTLSNTGGQAIDEFAVYFDLGLYENLIVTSSPANWDTFVVQPNAGLPDDGFMDSFALVNPLAPGMTISGFSVSFDFLGMGTPGAQFFELIDPFTFESIGEGITELRTTVTVPEPATWLLTLAGLFALRLVKRRPTGI